MKKKDIIFIVTESILYITFVVHDLLSIQSSLIKYSGIVLCLIYTLINRKKFGSLAMFFTAIADFFLLLIDKYYIVGVTVFLAVQIIYCLYLAKENVRPNIGLRIAVPLVLVLVLNNTGMLNGLNVLIVIYFSQLLLSCVFSLNNKKLRLFSLGLSLFVCCDICVGLHNIFIYNGTIALLQWIFYLPSQVLIACSISK